MQKKLKNMNPMVQIRKLGQKEFSLDPLFAEYFAGRRTSFTRASDSLLLAVGTSFQQRVWRHISAIPYAATITYRQLAELAGSPGGARAAAAACGANPVALIIPCHRVVAQDGPGGYTGGVSIKKALLALEQTGGI